MVSTINSAAHPIVMWTDVGSVEPAAIEQLENVANLPYIYKHVAVMPDVHLGYGATIGSVIAMENAVAPSAVGVDIGCLDADTEFLSRSGWVKISEWDGHEVLQYNLFDNTTSFVKPQYIKRKNTKGFYRLIGKYGLDQMVSEDHRVLFFYGTAGRGFTPRTEFARDFVEHHNSLSKGNQGGFKATFSRGDTMGLGLSDNEIKVIAMIQADGHIRKNGTVELHFSKARKIERCKMLLKASGLSSTQYNNADGSITFAVRTSFATKSLSAFWRASASELKVLADESLLWDGHVGRMMFYSTNNKENADIIQYAFAVNGVRCSINHTDYPKNKRWKRNYQVILTNNEYVGMTPDKVSMVPSSDGFEYCFSVPTSYFVARRNGYIFITGNCGMAAVKTNLKAEDLPEDLKDLRVDIEWSIPTGFHAHKEPKDGIAMIGFNDLTVDLSKISEKAHCQVGTLGGGNHFIELCLDDDGSVWMMLHSGSRGVGKQIADAHIKVAKQLEHNADMADPQLSVFLSGTEEMRRYRHDLDWAQRYARLNRKTMLALYKRAMVKHFPLVQFEEEINCHHNYVSEESHFGSDVLVTRKGAISAQVGELGIIPGSMGTGSYIVRGLGNPMSFNSASHGAGRVMSRTRARKEFTVEDLAEQTSGVECRKDKGVLDEIPGAYKDIEVVMNNQKDLVEVVAHLHAVLCVKG